MWQKPCQVQEKQNGEKENGSFCPYGTLCYRAAPQNPDIMWKFLDNEEPAADWYMKRSQFESDFTCVFPADL